MRVEGLGLWNERDNYVAVGWGGDRASVSGQSAWSGGEREKEDDMSGEVLCQTPSYRQVCIARESWRLEIPGGICFITGFTVEEERGPIEERIMRRH